MYDTILIPTDGSQQAANAVKAGIALASELDATVHAVYVVEQFEGRIVPITGEQEEKSEEYHDYGQQILDEVAKAAEDVGVECTTTVLDGIVHKEISDHADDNDIDLIVMGKRGLTNIEEAILGSTADKIIRTVNKPVTVVHKEPTYNVLSHDEIHLSGW